ncbi:MAG: sterol desaturase family protein [Lewinella sp.]|uniref:sterol desaturase family protein n=1 Tax=Lewinella sp. TaxID=2004506 RepID=UPI003D6B4781
MNPITGVIITSVLIVIGALVLESYVAKKKKMTLYRLSDSITNLSCGMMERVFDFFLSVLILFGFQYIYENVAPYQIPMNIGTWVIAILAFDFLAYWFHRLSHEINFLWAAHIVHHQSEELNLTTVFRASLFAVFYRVFFFVWMALAGFNAITIGVCTMILGLFQLFTHSRVIGKLGVFEKFLTTPSHHRVHHGRNEKYMDHNYSHIFIIWDKIFGTFIEEDEEPTYGITTGFESANAYNANFSYWRNLLIRAKKTKKISDKIKVFTKGPAWTPDDVPHLPNEYKTDDNGNRIHHHIPISFELGAYILLNVAITFSAFAALMVVFKPYKPGEYFPIEELFSNHQILALVGIVLLSVFAHARMMEQTKFAIYIDAFRLIVLITLTFFAFKEFPFANWLIPTASVVCGVMLLWLIRLGVKASKKEAVIAA